MTIGKKIKPVLLFLGICLGIYVVFMLYYLFGDGCWNCSPQDYYARGIAMISENDNNLKKGVKYLKTAAKKVILKQLSFLENYIWTIFRMRTLQITKKKLQPLEV